MRTYDGRMRHLVGIVGLLLCLAANAADRLPALSADLKETSVSGLSSGGYMAVQFHLAHSAIVRGAGVFAGGLWGCAKGSADRATGECSHGSPAAKPFVATAKELARMGSIDPMENLARTHVWLFSGYNDGVVRQSATNALADFYRALLPAGHVFYRNDLKAGHALVTLDRGGRCELTGGDFIADCDYDAVGALLQFIHGRLAPPGSPSSAALRSFDQTEFALGSARSSALADEGYVYIPKACEAAGGCRIHVALHGCRQNAESVGDAFYAQAGYNRWAETNRIVVLYPQARATWGMPLNPYGCWDWWGYTGSAGYLAKAAPQIAAIRAMVDRIASGSTRPGALPAASAGAALVDASADAMALAWSPVVGAARYEVSTGDRRVAVIAPETAAAVDGLAPASRQTITWRALDAVGKPLGESRFEGATAAAAPACDPWLANNYEHVRAGRAYVLWGLVYAAGSNQSMGWWNIFTTTQLHRIPGGFAVGPCS
ncbi:MAG: PHB depolymerase family esterase [Burkholderiales bacterium]|nr:PHB depolymerase family esterase [Burkholderiales bacterium]